MHGCLWSTTPVLTRFVNLTQVLIEARPEGARDVALDEFLRVVGGPVDETVYELLFPGLLDEKTALGTLSLLEVRGWRRLARGLVKGVLRVDLEGTKNWAVALRWAVYWQSRRSGVCCGRSSLMRRPCPESKVLLRCECKFQKTSSAVM